MAVRAPSSSTNNATTNSFFNLTSEDKKTFSKLALLATYSFLLMQDTESRWRSLQEEAKIKAMLLEDSPENTHLVEQAKKKLNNTNFPVRNINPKRDAELAVLAYATWRVQRERRREARQLIENAFPGLLNHKEEITQTVNELQEAKPLI